MVVLQQGWSSLPRLQGVITVGEAQSLCGRHIGTLLGPGLIRAGHREAGRREGSGWLRVGGGRLRRVWISGLRQLW